MKNTTGNTVSEQEFISKEQYQKLLSENQYLKQQLGELKRLIFGSKSERFVPSDDSQLGLFNILQQGQQVKQKEEIKYTREKPVKEKQKPVRASIPSHLPRVGETVGPKDIEEGSRKIGEDVYFVVNSYPHFYPEPLNPEDIVPTYREDDGDIEPIAQPIDIGYIEPIQAANFITIASMSITDEDKEVEKETGETGKLHILDSTGVAIHEVPLPDAFGSPDWNGGLAAPTLANIDEDFDLEIVINTAHSGFIAFDLPGTHLSTVFWGTGRGSQLRAGHVGPK